MSKQLSIPQGAEQWLINLILMYNEVKSRTDISIRQIAEKENLAEKSVQNVFSGKAKNPGVDLVRRIIHALGGSWTEIFAESCAVIGSQDLASLQEENAELRACIDGLKIDLDIATKKADALERENETLKIKLDYEAKISNLHDLYGKLLQRFE